jgi:hypothetical protein
VLAVDASGSDDQRRFGPQQQVYVAAFRDPRVLHAIQSGDMQAIAANAAQIFKTKGVTSFKTV